MIDEEEKETKKKKKKNMIFLEYYFANRCATYFIYQNCVDFNLFWRFVVRKKKYLACAMIFSFLFAFSYTNFPE